MRDLLADLFARLRASSRQERLYAVLGAVAVLVVLRFAVGWLIDYRRGVKEDIQLTADRLANAQRMLARAPEMQKHLTTLQDRYAETVAQLVPGDTPTLAAAALQDRVSGLAAGKNVSLQTTQVMKDEAVGPFRKVSLRITASGELRQLADFLAELEYGPLRVSVPFIELSRRGAGRRDAAARVVSATIELAGVVQGSAASRPSADGAPASATAPEGAVVEQTVPAAQGAPSGPAMPAAGTSPGTPAQDESAAGPTVPEDPMGTGRLAGPPP